MEVVLNIVTVNNRKLSEEECIARIKYSSVIIEQLCTRLQSADISDTYAKKGIRNLISMANNMKESNQRKDTATCYFWRSLTRAAHIYVDRIPSDNSKKFGIPSKESIFDAAVARLSQFEEIILVDHIPINKRKNIREESALDDILHFLKS